VVSFTARSLYPQGNSPWYPLERRLCGYQSQTSIETALNKNERKKPRKREVNAINFIKEINNEIY
jgi:hypothetical protein